MAIAGAHRWLLLCVCALVSVLKTADGYFVDITYVESAVAKGGVCLDGSPPAYHLSPGFGSGVNNWLVQIEGGGWCNNVTTCLARKNTRLGSSKAMVKQLAFSGIFSNKQAMNPDFYSWNKVKVRYCDGSSFTGDVERVDPATNLHFRGARVFQAVMEDLLAKGMSRAENAILSGCSAGGLTSKLHCDNFRSLLPGANVKCLADAGYFINNAKDITGTQHVRKLYNDVVTTHGSAKINLHAWQGGPDLPDATVPWATPPASPPPPPPEGKPKPTTGSVLRRILLFSLMAALLLVLGSLPAMLYVIIWCKIATAVKKYFFSPSNVVVLAGEGESEGWGAGPPASAPPFEAQLRSPVKNK